MAGIMRKISILTAVAALVLAACTKEAAPVAEKTYSMEVVLSSTEVKTALSDGTIIWKTGDKIGGRQRYFRESDGARTSQAKYWSMNKDAASTSVGSSTWTVPKEGTEIQYYFFYPYDKFDATWYTDGEYVKPLVTLSEKQTPVADSYDPLADIIVSKVISSTETLSSVKPEFTRINSLCNITVKNLPSAAAVDSVRFSAKAGGSAVKMAGQFYALMSTGVPGTFAKSQTHVTMDCSALAATASSSEGLSTYFCCLPFSLAAGDSFKVEVFAGGVNYVKNVTLSSPMDFSQGRMAKFSVDMASSCPSFDWITVSQKASSGMTGSNAIAYWTASATASVAEVLYGYVSAADYLAAASEGTLDALYGTVATNTLSASSISNLNAGKAVNLSVTTGILVPASDNYVLLKVKKSGSEEYVNVSCALKTDFFGFTATNHSNGAGYPYHKFYASDLSALKFLCVAKTAIASPSNANCLAYFNENISSAVSYGKTTISAINNAGAAGYGVVKASSFELGSGVEYISMMYATATDGSTKFCWSSATTK